MKYTLLFFIIFFSRVCFSQQASFEKEEITISKYIDGTLLNADGDNTFLVIIIADSGPIDRDGNQDFQKNNNLKNLAMALTNNGISTLDMTSAL